MLQREIEVWKMFREHTRIAWFLNREIVDACVDCSGCSACCSAPGIWVELTDYDWNIEGGLHPENPKIRVLRKKLDGSCLYLEEGRCSVYSYRPVSCRMFDCRDFAYGLRRMEAAFEPLYSSPHLVELLNRKGA